jgi:hypothetical protein
MPLRCLIVHASSVFINIVLLVAEFTAHKCNQILLQNQQSHLIPYHTSILSGEGWIQELMSRNPNHIRTELTMHAHVSQNLITVLRTCGLIPSGHLSYKEQLAIFLYTSVTGITVWHVGECFQHSNDTISK